MGSFSPNDYGIYDLAGNVWEWCSDWYHSNYYSMIGDKKIKDPKGPETSYDPMEPFSEKKLSEEEASYVMTHIVVDIEILLG